jgi:hypothetical protein
MTDIGREAGGAKAPDTLLTCLDASSIRASRALGCEVGDRLAPTLLACPPGRGSLIACHPATDRRRRGSIEA